MAEKLEAAHGYTCDSLSGVFAETNLSDPDGRPSKHGIRTVICARLCQDGESQAAAGACRGAQPDLLWQRRWHSGQVGTRRRRFLLAELDGGRPDAACIAAR